MRYFAGVMVLIVMVAANAQARLWTPAETNTTAWYDASDASTVQTNGTGVTNWLDKSGNSNHATQATASYQPETGTRTIGGLNALDFDGSDELGLSTLGLSTNAFAIFVVQPDSDAAYSVLGSQNNSGGNTHWELWSGNTIVRHFSTARLFSQDLNTPESGTFMLSYNADSFAPDYVLHLNGTEVKQHTSGFTFQDNINRIGKGYVNGGHIDGAIAEIIILNDWASQLCRQQMEGYLAHKWGLEGDLPAGHPYKDKAPKVVDGSRVRVR